MPDKTNTIYREMLIDLLYRLRLAEEQFCQVTDQVLSAISTEDTAGRLQAQEQLTLYAQALQIIYADFLHVIDGCHITFPADIRIWQWYEPDGEEMIAQTMERLHTIAEGLELRLNTEMLKREVRG